MSGMAAQRCPLPPAAAPSLCRSAVAKRACRPHPPRAAALAELADAGADLAAGPLLVPLAAAAVAAAGLAALRLYSYSQLEYVTAAMLGRHVRAGGARVLQLGGTTRDVYYYPEGTLEVLVAGPGTNAGLWEQAGVQAAVPVRALERQPLAALAARPGSSADSIVAIGQLGGGADLGAFQREAARVLAPGGTLIFIQRLAGGGPLAALAGGGSTAEPAAIEGLVGSPLWDFAQWDVALEAQAPHAVGVAIKPLTSSPPGASVDTTAFEQLMRRKGGGGDKGAAGAGKGSRKGFRK